MAVTLNDKYLKGVVNADELKGMEPMVKVAHEMIENKNGLGNDFLGWVDLPVNYDKEEFERIKKAAAKIKADSEVLIVIGIGGSYLGARAAIELLRSTLYNSLAKDTPKIFFAGNSISPTYLNEVIELVKDKDFSVNIISKSGTTTEPALAFRVFREMLEEKYGKDGAKGRIYATTDKSKGALRNMSDEEGYETFVVPDNVGGRYSVLTAVGLLPIAVAGIDIDALMKGAADAREQYMSPELDKNDCYRYAAIRNILYRSGKKIEMMAAYEPDYTMMCEWFKQLFGESEGKEKKGMLPASMINSEDLHSMGQYMQDGLRFMTETFLAVDDPGASVVIEPDPDFGDGFDYLDGMDFANINRAAEKATIQAHAAGGVPCMVLRLPRIDERTFGLVYYFFMVACALSGRLLGVDPFDQEGVEEYKRSMFAALGKPGVKGFHSD